MKKGIDEIQEVNDIVIQRVSVICEKLVSQGKIKDFSLKRMSFYRPGNSKKEFFKKISRSVPLKMHIMHKLQNGTIKVFVCSDKSLSRRKDVFLVTDDISDESLESTLKSLVNFKIQEIDKNILVDPVVFSNLGLIDQVLYSLKNEKKIRDYQKVSKENQEHIGHFLVMTDKSNVKLTIFTSKSKWEQYAKGVVPNTSPGLLTKSGENTAHVAGKIMAIIGAYEHGYSIHLGEDTSVIKQY